MRRLGKSSRPASGSTLGTPRFTRQGSYLFRGGGCVRHALDYKPITHPPRYVPGLPRNSTAFHERQPSFMAVLVPHFNCMGYRLYTPLSAAGIAETRRTAGGGGGGRGVVVISEEEKRVPLCSSCVIRYLSVQGYKIYKIFASRGLSRVFSRL